VDLVFQVRCLSGPSERGNGLYFVPFLQQGAMAMKSCWRKEVCNGDEARAYSKVRVTMRRKKGDASHLSQKKIAQFPQRTDA
jgi:hypothetical protein